MRVRLYREWLGVRPGSPPKTLGLFLAALPSRCGSGVWRTSECAVVTRARLGAVMIQCLHLPSPRPDQDCLNSILSWRTGPMTTPQIFTSHTSAIFFFFCLQATFSLFFFHDLALFFFISSCCCCYIGSAFLFCFPPLNLNRHVFFFLKIWNQIVAVEHEERAFLFRPVNLWISGGSRVYVNVRACFKSNYLTQLPGYLSLFLSQMMARSSMEVG